ncbi:MAG: enoyl-CoA hydratase/isomerase family protein [Burkholderiaceae bacterium]|nr:enoyl-CoA hydratase/isomerase family protein [Burkholderiaceae bacterium]
MSLRRVPLATPKILAEVEDGIGWLRINQPERRNAISLEMWQGLADACTAFDADADVRVVVMHGVGGQSFAAGADISEFQKERANAEQKARYGEILARGQDALAHLAKPLIAMIQGYCIGGGMAIALKADVRFAALGSRFGIPAARLGLGYEYEGVAALARLVGPSVAKDMLFSARQLESDEALRLGLVNFVCAPADLEQRVRDYAAGIAANAPLTIRACKAAVALFERYSANAEADAVDELVNQCFDSADYREGRTAFLEKREPRFSGR